MTKPARTLFKMWRTKMTDYPSTLSLESVQLLIKIIKDRSIVENKVQFAFAAWNLAGYLLQTLLGSPNDEPSANQIDDEFATLLKELGVVLDEVSDEGLFTASNEAEAIDLNVLITLITALVQLLLSLNITADDDE